MAFLTLLQLAVLRARSPALVTVYVSVYLKGPLGTQIQILKRDGYISPGIRSLLPRRLSPVEKNKMLNTELFH